MNGDYRQNGCLDPSNPQALEYIKRDVKRICDWGYTLIKHDFSTFDLFGRWGFEMNPLVTKDGWHFYDESMTSAEVVKLLYKAILEASKETNTIILGCNAIGHLGAGLMHMNRTGDDTSGLNWERTRSMGINTLAFVCHNTVNSMKLMLIVWALIMVFLGNSISNGLIY